MWCAGRSHDRTTDTVTDDVIRIYTRRSRVPHCNRELHDTCTLSTRNILRDRRWPGILLEAEFGQGKTRQASRWQPQAGENAPHQNVWKAPHQPWTTSRQSGAERFLTNPCLPYEGSIAVAEKRREGAYLCKCRGLSRGGKGAFALSVHTRAKVLGGQTDKEHCPTPSALVASLEQHGHQSLVEAVPDNRVPWILHERDVVSLAATNTHHVLTRDRVTRQAFLVLHRIQRSYPGIRWRPVAEEGLQCPSPRRLGLHATVALNSVYSLIFQASGQVDVRTAA
mmetsp:Transcript_29375/g.77647  ORF Transcript_29375/g.77647 Transcript_29375/m.77647 type:complete len:281 (-) Transcript_29375:809-1651(-)